MVWIGIDFLKVFRFFLGLQTTDVELDARITALEENGGGNTQNGKISKF